MQIVYHIGANCTDDDRLLKSLLKNTEQFAGLGTMVPGPGKYRRLIRETIQNLHGADPAADTREILLDAILHDETATRLVMSNASFMCVSNRIFEGGAFYDLAASKIAALSQLFLGDEIEIFLGLRNPATFVPAAFEESKHENFAEYIGPVSLDHIQWSDLIRRIQAAAPNIRITTWCNEDTPLIWAQLIRELAGVDPLTRITGGYDLLASIMTNDGMSRFLSYLKTHPPQSEAQKRRIIAAFLDKYAIEDEVVEEVDLPGWTELLMEKLTARYEADILEIERMPGVRFITP